jgi:signal transduction histidine kinase
MRARRFDILLVGGFAVALLAELAVGGMDRWYVEIPAALCFAAALWWRAVEPRLMLAVTVVGLGLNVAAGGDIVTAYFAYMIVVYSLGRRLGGRERLAALALIGVAAGVHEALLYGLDDAPFQFILIGALAAVGGLVRARAELTRELAERTHELDAERAAAEQAAALEERRRIARELHDVIAHSVSLMVVQAGGARRQLTRDPERALDALAQIEAVGDEARTEVRRLFGLLGETTSDLGLDGLDALAERTRAAGLPVTVDVSGTPRALDRDAGAALFRLVQEGLTNTLKHAGPGATAYVTVAWGEAEVEVVVRDTGWGTAGPRGEGSRRGQEGMRERVAAHGGTVEAGSAGSDAGGYEVRARLPLAREEVPA